MKLYTSLKCNGRLLGEKMGGQHFDGYTGSLWFKFFVESKRQQKRSELMFRMYVFFNFPHLFAVIVKNCEIGEDLLELVCRLPRLMDHSLYLMCCM